MMKLPFEYTYSELPASLFVPFKPRIFSNPELVIANTDLASELGMEIDFHDHHSVLQTLLGLDLPKQAQPIAMAYSGHQFGYFTQLGDGRAFLLGEWITPGKQRLDIHIKGSGRTAFARNGDGHAVLGPMLREYIISEAMHALQVPTTRSLAVITTGESVFRENVKPGAVLVRLASSHIRFGTFQYAAIQGDSILQTLLEYTVQRHYPHLFNQKKPLALAFIDHLITQIVKLVVNWERIGFIHGVMNTDNMAISGETFDYGPCAFMDDYSPHCVFSSIDTAGRYAFKNQAPIAQWNLARLAEALLPLIDPNPDKAIELATDCLNQFPSQYKMSWLNMMQKKIGLTTPRSDDIELIESLLLQMQRHNMDYSDTFYKLTYERESLFNASDHPLHEWLNWWGERLKLEAKEAVQQQMQAVNPVVIPRNHRVEQALLKAEKEGDLSAVFDLLDALSAPYTLSEGAIKFNTPPRPEERISATYCGT